MRETSRFAMRALVAAAFASTAAAFGPLPSLPNPFATLSAPSLPNPFDAILSPPSTAGVENGLDDEYPWRFDGRLWFRPSLVRTPEYDPPGNIRFLSLFGWTLGGNVCLEYDESPVGPYVEYVTMGALVAKRGAIGQWGSRLFVSTQPAEAVCQRVWDVPAEVAAISFDEDGGALCVEAAPALVGGAAGRETITVSGWANTRSGGSSDDSVGNVPVLWTPSIKALWAPIRLPGFGGGDDDENALPLHNLRLSASSLRLHLCGQASSEELGVPLPFGLTVDGLRIEIAREGDEPL